MHVCMYVWVCGCGCTCLCAGVGVFSPAPLPFPALRLQPRRRRTPSVHGVEHVVYALLREGFPGFGRHSSVPRRRFFLAAHTCGRPGGEAVKRRR